MNKSNLIDEILNSIIDIDGNISTLKNSLLSSILKNDKKVATFDILLQIEKFNSKRDALSECFEKIKELSE